MADSESPIDTEHLLGWDAAVPPPEFAERVVEAWQADRKNAEGGSSRKSTRVSWWVVGFATVAALVLVTWVGVRRGPAHSGSLVAHGRQTVELGERAVAVAKADAVLTWRVERDGSTEVEQRSGEVFYRVDEGSGFVVETPYGIVEVTGTCFTVEVSEMNRNPSNLKAMAVAAAVSATLVVTVYEGQVLLASEGTEVELQAGERAEASPGRGAVVRSVDDPATELLSVRVRRQAQEIDELRAKLGERDGERQDDRASAYAAAEGPFEEEDPQAKAERCAHLDEGRGGCSFFDPDPLTLKAMARCAVVRTDAPSFLNDESMPEPEGVSRKLGLDRESATQALETVQRFREDYVRQLEALYLEMGGNPEVLSELTARALAQALGKRFDPEELEAAARRRAEDLAEVPRTPGLPEDPRADRYIALVYGVGDRFESALGEAIGPAMARMFRAAHDGWDGDRSSMSGHCLD